MSEEADRAALAADLRHRAELVRESGWDTYLDTWDEVDVIGVRAVLNEPGALDDAVEIWADILWEQPGPNAGLFLDLTRRWFAAVRGDEPSPYLTVGSLRELLAGWPDDRPVMVGGLGGGVARVVYSCHERVHGTGDPGGFETVAQPPAEWLEPDPPLPAPPGEFTALVLRGEDQP